MLKKVDIHIMGFFLHFLWQKYGSKFDERKKDSS